MYRSIGDFKSSYPGQFLWLGHFHFFGNGPFARNGYRVQKAPSRDIAAARKLKANWFATQTGKQLMVNNELPLFKRTNQETRYEQLLHYCLASWETSQRGKKNKEIT